MCSDSESDLDIGQELRRKRRQFFVGWSLTFSLCAIAVGAGLYKAGWLDLFEFYVLSASMPLVALVTMWPMWTLLMKDLAEEGLRAKEYNERGEADALRSPDGSRD